MYSCWGLGCTVGAALIVLISGCFPELSRHQDVGVGTGTGEKSLAPLFGMLEVQLVPTGHI